MRAVESAAAIGTALLVLIVAFQAAKLTWRLYGMPEDDLVPALPAGPAAPVPSAPESPGYGFLRSLHLFGEPPQSAPTELPKPVEAPKTNLQLALRGIFRVGSSGPAVAIIADSSGEERPYRVGDTVPGDATIERILAYSVLLERNGRLESLDLPREGVTGAAAAVSSRTEPQAPVGEGESGDTGYLPRELLRSPGEITRHLTFAPVHAGGRLQGYRIGPAADSGLFSRAGLKPGDVVTRVNGIALNASDALSLLLEDAGTASHFLLDIQNGDSRRKLDIRLD
jgi:general secretion pathway protein C